MHLFYPTNSCVYFNDFLRPLFILSLLFITDKQDLSIFLLAIIFERLIKLSHVPSSEIMMLIMSTVQISLKNTKLQSSRVYEHLQVIHQNEEEE